MTDMLGPYQITGELGRGAMAVVWRAWDSSLDREVAIKEPTLAATADADMRAEFSARFVREAKAAAGLNHPGVVTVFAADVFDGRPAIVMEVIEGSTLADILRAGPLEPTSAIAITDQLLDVVGYAHGRGVIHRDVKPDNVFITRDGRVKLADFGIAHVSSSKTLTVAGTMMGTPGYMAPEQIQGERVGPQADIFAIGVMLYEMLTGINPFGASDSDLSLTTVMYRVVHEQPPAIGIVGRELGGHVPTIIAKALAKDPGKRYQSAAEMRSDLRSRVAPLQLNRRRPVPTWIWSTAAGVLLVGAAVALLTSGGVGAKEGTAAVSADAKAPSAEAAEVPRTIAQAESDASDMFQTITVAARDDQTYHYGYDRMARSYRDSHSVQDFGAEYSGLGRLVAIKVEAIDDQTVRGYLVISDDRIFDADDPHSAFVAVYENGSLCLVSLAAAEL